MIKHILAIVGAVVIGLILSVLIVLAMTRPPVHKPPRIMVLEDQSTISMNLPVLSSIVSQMQLEAMAKDKALPVGAPLFIYVNSPGGEVDSGMQFIDQLRGFGRPVHTVNQYSASMAFITAELLDGRYITPNGVLMAHPISIEGLGGQIPGSLISRTEFFHRQEDVVNDFIAHRIGLKPDFFKTRLLSEIWIGGYDAVDANFADEVVSVKCGDSMRGTYIRTVSVYDIKLAVEFSKCPLILEPISVKPIIEGAPKSISKPEKRKNEQYAKKLSTRSELINALLESSKKQQSDRARVRN